MIKAGVKSSMASVVVDTSGCWDLFHIGHRNFLERSKALGDFLVAGVNSCESRVIDGLPKPIIPFIDRIQIVKALACVDIVVPYTSSMQSVEMIKFHGATIRTVRNGYFELQAEAYEELEKMGVKHVVIQRTPGVSTTCIKKRVEEEICNE